VKVISFSLWGDDPTYTVGAIKNAELAKKIFPGWECWYYVGKSVPEEITIALSGMDNCRVFEMESEGNWDSMFWRFEAAAHEGVEVMLSRDTDSRLNHREKAAVDEWLNHPQAEFHIMRDHPWHTTEILGGMWGARDGVVKHMPHWIKSFITSIESRGSNYWQVDQDFLKEVVYPKVKDTALVHDAGVYQYNPFPTPRKGKYFVGQAFDEHDNPLYPEHMEMIRENF